MTAISVDRIEPIQWQAMSVTPAHINDIYGVITLAKAKNLWTGKPEPVNTSQGVGWTVTIIYADNRPHLFAQPGYWVVVDQDLNVEVLTGPDGVAKYHENVAYDWKALTEAPVITENGDGTETVTFWEPQSLNGPFTYQIEQTPADGGDVQHVETLGDPVRTITEDEDRLVLGAHIALTVRPAPGAGTLQVTVTDGYGKTAASASVALAAEGAS